VVVETCTQYPGAHLNNGTGIVTSNTNQVFRLSREACPPSYADSGPVFTCRFLTPLVLLVEYIFYSHLSAW